MPAEVPPDEYVDKIVEFVIKNSIEPTRWSYLRLNAYEQTKAHPKDIEYVLSTMLDEEGDHRLNGILTWRSDRLLQANTKKLSQKPDPRKERFWG